MIVTGSHPGAADSSNSTRSEAGTGLIATSAGVAAFLSLLLLAVQLAVNLTTISTVNAAGYDSARLVASHRVDHRDPGAVAAAERAAEARFHRLLGTAGRDAQFSWTVDADAVHLRVQVDPPAVLPRALGRSVGLDRVDRTYVVRIEEVR